nr:DUF2235 domain-containing protein [Pseudomonas sp. GX19020]
MPGKDSIIGLRALFSRFFRPRPRAEVEPASPAVPGFARRRVDHVVILDGTMASLRQGERTNAGRVFLLLSTGKAQAGRSLYYDKGIPWRGWKRIMDLVEGRGIEEQILRAYGHLASHYREGDRIFLFGYSRGAFAVRSLAGVIAKVGLLRHEAATERNLHLAWRWYQRRGNDAGLKAFRQASCHARAPIRMIGVWETVKALGLRFPLLWMLTEGRYAFHDPHPVADLDFALQALALDETRVVFDPVLWQGHPGGGTHIEQVWFRGAHGDIGGHLGNFAAARPLSNIPLVWMLDRAAQAGLELPEGWRRRFPCDPAAPMVGTWRGLGAAFLYRRRRVIGRDPSERLHESVPETERLRWHLARQGAGDQLTTEISQTSEASAPISKG